MRAPQKGAISCVKSLERSWIQVAVCSVHSTTQPLSGPVHCCHPLWPAGTSAPAPDFKSLMATKDRLWCSPRWARGVYVQQDAAGFAPQGGCGDSRKWVWHVCSHWFCKGKNSARGRSHCEPQGKATHVPYRAGASAGAPAPRPHRRPLHVTLLRMTARVCSVCDRRGQHPFTSDRQLQGHVRGAHGRSLCDLCLSQVGGA